jgi:hypothetical protein
MDRYIDRQIVLPWSRAKGEVGAWLDISRIFLQEPFWFEEFWLWPIFWVVVNNIVHQPNKGSLEL